MKKNLYIAALGLVISLALQLFPANAVAQSKNYKAYGVFVFSFARYIEWPAEMSKTEEIKIAVYGSGSLYEELASSLSTRTVNGKKFLVQAVDSPDKLQNFSIVVLPAHKNGQLQEVIKATEKQATLIVTEHDGLIRKGAAISFLVTDDKKLTFELNEEALLQRQLKMATSLKSFAWNGE